MASKLLIAFFLGAISMTVVSAQNFDFFYFVQQWPGSYCDTDSGCCFPLAGSPGAQFGIHGLWPNYNDGGYPSKCGGDAFNPNVVHIANLMITLYRNSVPLIMDPVEIVVQKITSSQGPGYRRFSRTDKES
jgi:hypothetical protein